MTHAIPLSTTGGRYGECVTRAIVSILLTFKEQINVDAKNSRILTVAAKGIMPESLKSLVIGMKIKDIIEIPEAIQMIAADRKVTGIDELVELTTARRDIIKFTLESKPW